MAANPNKEKEDNHPFTTCILRVNVHGVGWQKVVAAVLTNVQGVSNFRMDEDGRIEVSGTVNPTLLLKMLAKAGKKAEMCWWQFGQCSSNLFMPEYKSNNNQYYARNGYHGGGDDHGHGYYGHNKGYYGGGGDHGHGYYGHNGYYGGGDDHGCYGHCSGYHGGGGGHGGYYHGDDRHLHYEGQGNRPLPQIWYEPYQEPPPPTNPPKSGEGVSCCKVM